MKTFHLHLVSDSTGETLESVAKACLSQFDQAEAIKHFWPMIRSERQIDRVLDEIALRPGLVIFTLVNKAMRDRLHSRCVTLGIPAVPVLDAVLEAFGQFIGERARGLPGRQHQMDAAYHRRIDAVHYTMAHDDGLAAEDLNEADIILVGVSRSSKTPTSIYLANRGYKTANIPFVPGVPPPPQLFTATHPLIVGLVTNPERLIQIRRNRLRSLNQTEASDYVDMETVNAEVLAARRLFTEQGWPSIDVTRRSIEETAAAILNLLNTRVEKAPLAAAPVAEQSEPQP